MATNMNRPKRMLVRVTLVTGTTVATLVGAQALSLMDRQSQFSLNSAADATSQPTFGPQLMPTATSINVYPTIEIQHVAPSITILRQPGQVVAQPTPAPSVNTLAQTVIQPPSPVQINAPAPIVIQQGSPVIIQQPSTTTTQSTR